MSDASASSVLDRAVSALQDPSVTSFTRAQVAFIVEHVAYAIDLARQFGYEEGLAAGRKEGGAAAILAILTADHNPPEFSEAALRASEMCLRARAAADAAPSGYKGGSVTEWGSSRPPIVVPEISTEVTITRDGLRWTA